MLAWRRYLRYGLSCRDLKELLVKGNDLPLEPGMAFSVEPDIYCPGRHGARIEDIVVCVPVGEPINRRDHDLVLLPA